MIRLLIKEITLISCSIYAFNHILNINKRKNTNYVLANLVLIFVITGVSVLSEKFAHSNTISIQLGIFFFPLALLATITIENSFIANIISYGISYLSFIISAITASILFTILHIDQHTSLAYTQLFVSIFQFLLIFFLFKIKRFRKGMTFLFNSENNLIFYLCILALFSYIVLTNNVKEFTTILLIVLFVIFTILLFYTWKKQIKEDYLKKITVQQIHTLEDEIQTQVITISELRQDVEGLSKLIHKDNKLIPAMVMTVTQYLQTLESTIENSPSKEKCQALLNDLINISQDRNGVLSGYELSSQKFISTNIVCIDALMNYMLNRAKNEKIHFELTGSSIISTLIKETISETDLNTLLADLIENAIISTLKSNSKNILVNVGISDESYYISIFDSGMPFSFKVLNSFGQKRITTHKDTNGSGIGLMTTYEFLQKYKASYILEEYECNKMFTKKINIKFDSQQNFAIYSYRAIELSKHVKRTNLHIYPTY